MESLPGSPCARLASRPWLLEGDSRRRKTRESLRPLLGARGQLKPASGGRRSSQVPARKKVQGKRATCPVPLQILKTVDSVLGVLVRGALQSSSLLPVEMILQVRHLPRAGLAGSLPCPPLKRRDLPGTQAVEGVGVSFLLWQLALLSRGARRPPHARAPPRDGSRAEICWDVATVPGECSPGAAGAEVLAPPWSRPPWRFPSPAEGTCGRLWRSAWKGAQVAEGVGST